MKEKIEIQHTSWEKEWEEYSKTVSADFISPGFGANEEVKSFIRKLLSQREQEIAEEVEKMKYTHEQIKDIGLAWQGHPCVGANDALDKVLSILKHNQ